MHGRKINMKEFCLFMVDNITPADLQEFKGSYHFGINHLNFQHVAEGGIIWDRSVSEIAPIHCITLVRYGGLPSKTQMVKNGNKIHNQGAANSCEAMAVNSWVTCQSILADITSVTSCDGKRQASSGRVHTKDVAQKLADHNAAEILATVLKTRTWNVIPEFHLHTMTIHANEKPKTTFDEYVETLPVHIQRLLMQYDFVLGG
jgi:hypothetical protein